MVIVYCSEKLKDFLRFPVQKAEIRGIHEEWNGHLFYINGRKCIIFMHKETLYTIVLFDILKKDLVNFHQVFVDSLVNQLYLDKILDSKDETKVRNIYSRVCLRSTDNDRKVIGSINDTVWRISYHQTGGENFLAAAKEYVSNYVNETPMSAIKYEYPKVLMKERMSANQ